MSPFPAPSLGQAAQAGSTLWELGAHWGVEAAQQADGAGRL